MHPYGGTPICPKLVPSLLLSLSLILINNRVSDAARPYMLLSRWARLTTIVLNNYLTRRNRLWGQEERYLSWYQSIEIPTDILVTGNSSITKWVILFLRFNSFPHSILALPRVCFMQQETWLIHSAWARSTGAHTSFHTLRLHCQSILFAQQPYWSVEFYKRITWC